MNQYRNWWDLVIIFSAIYNSILLPLESAFRPSFLESDNFKYVNSIIDIMFVIDILISFRTTYQCSESGYEIIDGLKIAKNYFVGRFIVDLVCTIPFE
jgi:hypothetical protein